MSSSELGAVAPAIERADLSAEVAAKPPVRRTGRKNHDVLGLAWLHGTLQIEVFRRHVQVGSWTSPTTVGTVEEFEAGLDAGLEALGFLGTEAFLILEHDRFVHQAEHAPAFSESAARAYLRGRVQRFEKETEPVLWISQRTVSVRKDTAFLLHMLPAAFYGALTNILLARHLDLTRILPLVVPLQLLLEESPGPKEQMVLMAAEAGDATTLVVARGNGELLFSRTMLARWESDPGRIAVEVNRSLLYGKQQFGAVIERIELLGAVSEQVKTEVQTRCGAEKRVIVRAVTVADWLQSVARLSARHPVNLIIGYLARKRRREFLRRALLAGCWLAVGLLTLSSWTQIQNWREGQRQLAGLQSAEVDMVSQRDQLLVRNEQLTGDQELIRQASGERLAPVPHRFLGYLSSIRSPDTHFTSFVSKWEPDTGGWTFRVEGQIALDEETARETLAALQRTLERGSLRIRCNDAARVFAAMPAMRDLPPVYRFALEGGLFEN